MKRWGTICVVVAAIALIATPAFAGGKSGQAGKSNTGHLYLFSKTCQPDWDIVEDGAWGKMTYRLSGPTFDYVFNGHGLVPGEEYQLIYYPDKDGNPWPRTDIICLDEPGTANNGGQIHLMGMVEIEGDLPDPDVDINEAAKIWLVLSSDVDCDADPQEMAGWNCPDGGPSPYLFEYDLITFDDTDE